MKQPKTIRVDSKGLAHLRAQGLSWRKIAVELDAGVGTVYRIGFAQSQGVGGRGQPLLARCCLTLAQRSL